MKLPVKTKYTAKDQTKADKANKFIGRGSAKSSTNAYARVYGDSANSGNYTREDIVFVSVEGNRTGRKPLDKQEITLAAGQSVTFITDNPENRRRPYNTGERALAMLLNRLGYEETPNVNNSVWTK